MAENTLPPITGEVQQSLEVSQSGQAEGNVNQSSSEGLPLPAPPVPNQPPSNANQQQGNNEKGNSLNIARFIVELLTLLVLLWYTIITNGLWNEADSANKLNTKNSHLDQRPWIGVASVKADPPFPTEGAPQWIRVTFKNSGKTPARNFIAAQIAEPVVREQQPNFSHQLHTTPGIIGRAGIIPPNGTGSRSTPVTTRGDGNVRVEAIMKPEGMKSIVNGKIQIYVHGLVSYDDIFGRSHWLTYCYYWIDPNFSGFGACNEHNDTDQLYEENPK